jgi:uncharacterized RDD family membrane protein YckC
MAKWYYAVGTETAGPVDEDELRALAVRGDLRSTTWVVPEGEQVWVQFGTVEDRLALAHSPEGGYALPLAAEPAPPTATNPTVVPEPVVPEPVGTANTGPLVGVRAPDRVHDAPGPGPGAPDWGAPPAPPALNSPVWTPDHAAYGDPYHVGNAGPDGRAFASWGSRVAAKLIDTVVLLVPTFLALRLFAWADVLDMIEQGRRSRLVFTAPSQRMVVANLVASVIAYAYYAVLNGRGQTVGKALVGIRVVRATDGAPIGPTKGLLRHLVQFAQTVPALSVLAWIFVLVDAFSPLWDDRSRALHDRFAGSVVVRSR